MASMSSPNDTPASSKVRAKLLCSEPVRFDAKKQTEKEREVPAQWVAEALREGHRGELVNAILTGPLDLRSAHVKQEFLLSGGEVRGPVKAFYARFARWVAFNAVRFHDSVGFKGARFAAELNCTGTHFLKGVNFEVSIIEGSFAAPGVELGSSKEDQANFNGCEIRRDATFALADFHGPAQFIGLNVRKQASFNGARFEQGVAFDRAEIGGSFFFRPAGKQRVEFGGKARFHGVKVGGQANFRKAQFEQPAFFDGAVFSGPSLFWEAEFFAPASFVAARFQLAAEFQGTQFQGPADFDYSRFEQEAHFAGAKFGDQLRLRDARMTTLSFQDGDATASFDDKTRVDLLGCAYDRLEIGNWRELMDRQSEFNPRPWSHLEKVLRTAGQDRDADDVYLQRRRVEHKQKWQRGEFGPWLLDSLHALFANYGIRPYQLLYTPILILLLGTALFFHPDATHHESSGQTPSELQKLTGNAPDGTNPSNQEFNEFTALDAARLSIRYFLPVEVPLATHWEASDKQYGPLRFSDYATGMKLAGWILVPLGIAALTGLLRRVTP